MASNAGTHRLAHVVKQEYNLFRSQFSVQRLIMCSIPSPNFFQQHRLSWSKLYSLQMRALYRPVPRLVCKFCIAKAIDIEYSAGQMAHIFYTMLRAAPFNETVDNRLVDWDKH